MVVIEDHPLMVMIRDKVERFSKLRELIGPSMKKQKDLFGVVFTLRIMIPQETKITEREGGLLIANSIGPNGFDHYLFFNPEFQGTSAEELKKIVKTAFLTDFH